MKKLRNFFGKVKKGWKNKDLVIDEKIYEIELWTWDKEEGQPYINYDEDKAWGLIKHLYFHVLRFDRHWHFFYENHYNVIRCSESVYSRVIAELDIMKIGYVEKGEWIDGSATVYKYQDIFKELFHNFSLMAMQEYDENELYKIYDRLTHCFLNHQFYVLKSFREKVGRQWEAFVMSYNTIYRAEFGGLLIANNLDNSKSSPPSWDKSKDKEEENIEEMEE